MNNISTRKALLYKLPPELNRRIKLLPEQKEEIYSLFHGKIQTNINQLARDFNVSPRTIRFVIYPEELIRNKKLAKQRPKRKHDSEYNRAAMQKTIDYKKQLIQEGKLTKDMV